jgi:hypothetical protein
VLKSHFGAGSQRFYRSYKCTRREYTLHVQSRHRNEPEFSYDFTRFYRRTNASYSVVACYQTEHSVSDIKLDPLKKSTSYSDCKLLISLPAPVMAMRALMSKVMLSHASGYTWGSLWSCEDAYAIRLGRDHSAVACCGRLIWNYVPTGISIPRATLPLTHCCSCFTQSLPSLYLCPRAPRTRRHAFLLILSTRRGNEGTLLTLACYQSEFNFCC